MATDKTDGQGIATSQRVVDGKQQRAWSSKQHVCRETASFGWNNGAVESGCHFHIIKVNDLLLT